MRKEMLEKQRIQMMLQRAVAGGEFHLVYQPKVSLSHRKIVGCEALLRWHPKGEGEQGDNSIGPAAFIPVAEESGQIVEIGEWVLEEACRQVHAWHCQGFEAFTVSVNVSTRQLRTGSFYRLVQDIFQRYSIVPSMMEFEITETCVLENQNLIVSELEKIHNMGAKISIDDFGTGNSSLDHLRKLPLDILKIDRSFVEDIGVDTQDEEIIRVMVAVSQTMNLEVIAEGAESVEQLHFLAGNQCDLIQGYYFSKPISASSMTLLLQDPKQNFVNEFELFDQYSQKIEAENSVSSKKPSEDEVRILICEDDLDFACLIQMTLAEGNVLSDIAISASDAKRLLKQNSYHGLSLDLRFGETDGLVLLKELREEDSTRQLPAVVVTGHPNQKTLSEQHADLFIHSWHAKPLDHSAFLQSINKAIQH